MIRYRFTKQDDPTYFPDFWLVETSTSYGWKIVGVFTCEEQAISEVKRLKGDEHVCS